MNGFEKAQAEYERRLFAPYDVGGALYDEEEYIRQIEEELDYYEQKANDLQEKEV